MEATAQQLASDDQGDHDDDFRPGGPAPLDRSGLEILDRQECLRLLAGAPLGRVGITNGALPVIVPINFRLVGDRIVFRTGIGTKLDSATCDEVVAFEADHLDPASGVGWSVAVTGLAREVVDSDEVAAAAEADIPRWTKWGSDRFVSLSTERISGRRSPTGPGLLRGGR